MEDYHPLKGKMFQILKPDGTLQPGEKSPLSDQEIFTLYQKMVFIRLADQRALMLQRQGRFGTYAPIWGQEACQVGSAYALQKGDWVIPAFREIGATLMMGISLKNFYLYWMGNEMGSRAPEGINVMPVSVPVGTQTLHAVGLAWAAKLKGDPFVTLVFFGDGATSKGDFHEAMNFAGVFNIPTIFFCQNNQFAISVPRSLQTASKTIAQKAIAYGFDGIQVDGNDLFGVVRVTRRIEVRIRKDWVDWFVKESGKSEAAVFDFLVRAFESSAREAYDKVPAVRSDGALEMVNWDETDGAEEAGSKVMPR
jgi:pyruvate dehydrogenase E1 component alpha subunit